MDNDPQGSSFTPSTRLNFVIGVSAILISLASFYATYLQARSADQQVKAMTYPLVQFSTSNYDLAGREQAITLSLTNNGVGPAIVRNVRYRYQDQWHRSVFEFLRACCEQAFEALNERSRSGEGKVDAQLVTSADRNIILPANDHINSLFLRRDANNADFWDLLNRERRKLGIEVCYCSLLDRCYQSNGKAEVTEVATCSFD